MAGMMGNNQLYNIKPFDGTGFSNWEFRVKLLLEQAQVSDVVTKEPPENTEELVEFMKMDTKARNIIVQCLSDNLLDTIKTKKTAKEIIETLERTYLKRGISTQVQLQRKLRSLKYVQGKPLNSFLTEFDQVVCELKAAGGGIKDNEIVCQLLSAMPEDYQAVTTAIDIMFCQDESKVTLDFVKNKLLMEEARQQKNRSETENNDVAFSGYKNKKWNRKVGKAGTSKESDAFPFRCHFCNEVGHMRRNCPKVKRKGGKQVNISEENGTIEKEEEEISFLTADGENTVQIKPEIREIKFVIDSGATHHLLRKEYKECVINERQVNHKVGVAKRGEKLEVLKEGDLSLLSESGRRIRVKDIWVCEDLSHNLLSVRKLEDLGFEVLFKNNKVTIRKGTENLLTGKRCGNLYFLKFHLEPFNAHLTNVENPMLMHRKMH